jgi:hypothetical protein
MAQLHVAAEDQGWLRKMVIAERSVLANLYRASLLHQANEDQDVSQETDENSNLASNEEAARATYEVTFDEEEPSVSEVTEFLKEEGLVTIDAPQVKFDEVHEGKLICSVPLQFATSLEESRDDPEDSEEILAATKKASVDSASEGLGPNTETAFKDHEREMTELKKQLEMFSRQLESKDPNDIMFD